MTSHNRNRPAGLLRQALSSRTVIADGAMGTMLQAYKFTEEDFRGEEFKNHPVDLKGNNDLLTLTRPDICLAIHDKFLEAGSDIIESSSSSPSLLSEAEGEGTSGLLPWPRMSMPTTGMLERSAIGWSTLRKVW